MNNCFMCQLFRSLFVKTLNSKNIFVPLAVQQTEKTCNCFTVVINKFVN